MLVQIVVEVLADEIEHEVAHRNARLDLLRTQLDLGLRLENRIGDLHRNGGDDRRADVRRIVILVVKFFHGLGDRLAERRLMRTALRGVLPVDERVVTLAITRSVGDGHLDVVAREVDRGVERRIGHLFVEQVQQTVLRNIGLPVEPEGQAEIEVGVVLHHLLDILHVVAVSSENLFVHAERSRRAVLFVDAALPTVALLDALREGDRARLAVADRTDRKLARKHVDGLDADAVQTDGLLEGRAAVFAAGIHLADGRRERFERNAAAVVAHRDHVVGHRDLDQLAGAHDEFVDRVVDNLLDQDIDAVVGLRAVAQLADIHARTQADMLARSEGYDGVVAVRGGCIE